MVSLDALLRLNSTGFQAGLNQAILASNAAVSQMSNQFNTLRNVAAFGAVGAAIGALSGKIIESTVSFEKYKRQLALVTGGIESANKKFKELQKVALQPGMDLASTVDAQIRLQTMGYTAEEATGHIQTLGKNVAAFGGGGEEMKGVILAFSQISSKGKVFAEEINQIAERLPTVRNLMKQAFGTSNTEELQKMGISAKDFTDKILNGMANAQPVAAGLDEELKKIKMTMASIMADENGFLSSFLGGVNEGITKANDFRKALISVYETFLINEDQLNSYRDALSFSVKMQEKLTAAQSQTKTDAEKKEADEKKSTADKIKREAQYIKTLNERMKVMSLSTQNVEDDQTKLDMVNEELKKITDIAVQLENLNKARENGTTLTEAEATAIGRTLGLLKQRDGLEQSILDKKNAQFQKEVNQQMMGPRERKAQMREENDRKRAEKLVGKRMFEKEVNDEWKRMQKEGNIDPFMNKEKLRRDMAKEKVGNKDQEKANATLESIFNVLTRLATA
jgi:tape measure domain-containing protein